MRFKTLPRKAYPSDLDLTDDQWMILEALVSPPRSGNLGRPQEVDLREGVNPIFYLNRSGYQWGMLPHDFPSRRIAAGEGCSDETSRQSLGSRSSSVLRGAETTGANDTSHGSPARFSKRSQGVNGLTN